MIKSMLRKRRKKRLRLTKETEKFLCSKNSSSYQKKVYWRSNTKGQIILETTYDTFTFEPDVARKMFHDAYTLLEE